jgi:hypothetical protein
MRAAEACRLPIRAMLPLPRKRLIPTLSLASGAAVGALVLMLGAPPDGTVEVAQLLRDDRVETGVVRAAEHVPDAVPAPWRYTVQLDDGRVREFGYAAARGLRPGQPVVVVEGALEPR